MRAHDALLHVQLLVGEDGDGRDFGAGAGGGGDGDEGQALVRHLVDAHVVLDRSSLVARTATTLATSIGEPPPKPTMRSYPPFLARSTISWTLLHGRLGDGLVVDADLQARLDAAGCSTLGDRAAARHAGVGDDEDLGARRSFLASAPSWATQPLPGDQGLRRAVDADLGSMAASPPLSPGSSFSTLREWLSSQAAAAVQLGRLLADLVSERRVGDLDERLGALAQALPRRCATPCSVTM